MKKLPAFIVSENNGRKFVSCTRTPFFILEIFEFSDVEKNLDFEAGKNLAGRIYYKNKYYSAIVRLILDRKESNKNKTERLLKQAIDYYLYNYLQNKV